MATADIESVQTLDWQQLADDVLAGKEISREIGRAILESSDDEILDILAAAFRVRRHYFGKKVHLYFLQNAKSGLCPEDCGYCSQSKVSDAPIEKYAWLNEEKLLAGAKRAYESKSRTYCIVASGRGPSNREVEHVAGVVRKIKDEYGLHICCCLGLLKPEQAETLSAAGVDRINHNLNTSRKYYDEICTTHTYQDRLDTLKVSSEAGMELCCGLIAGMGESIDDLLDVVFELKEVNVHSIPVNFLNAIDGTPLEQTNELNPRECLRVLALLRFVHPSVEIRIAGGREVNLRSMQAMGLYAANSMFVSDYLTTSGQPAEDDFAMIEDMGFEVSVESPLPEGDTSQTPSTCGN